MSMNLVTLLYLVASVCFIQTLKGLSHPTTSIRGNVFGMTGMGIAVLTTAAVILKLAEDLGSAGPGGLAWVLLGLLVGGTAGTLMARRVQMTWMPALVAFMHSMIGLAAALQKGSPIYGMPVLEAYKAKTVIVNKRSMRRWLCRAGQRAVLHGQDHDGVRRCQEGRGGDGQGGGVRGGYVGSRADRPAVWIWGSLATHRLEAIKPVCSRMHVRHLTMKGTGK